MKKTLIILASLLLLAGAGWSEDVETNANEAKYYDNAKVVRIKSVEGEGFVQRSYDEGNEEATANLPLFEKDTVGTTDGRLAVYLGRLNYLRLDADTVIVLEKVPQLRRTDLTVRLEEGSICLDIENLDQEKGIEIQTADCGIFLLDKGVYRINADREGRTEVIVMEGIAEVAGSDSSRNVRENQKIVMARGEMTERPYYFYASEKDDFDRWNEEQNRELGYARNGSSRYLQDGYEDYEYEMSRSGRWVYMSDFGSYSWCPYNTGADWMPYANGRWVWNPYYGYVWASFDTCGWFTHHYGRWHWSYAYGWHWLPSYHWSPAWVSWFWDNDYYGWCPLSWWNRPVIVINNHWDPHYDYHRGIPRHSRSTIIIRKHELSAANIHRVAVNKATLGQGGAIAYRGSAPGERLALNKVTVINARGRSVTYKQGAIVSAEKYRAQGSDIRSAVYRYDAAPTGFKSVRATKTGASEVRAKTGSESSARVRYSSGTENSSGSTVYRSKSGDSGGSGSAVVRKSDDSGGNTGQSGYRSKSGGSSSSSSSSSSGGSSSTARKKKKEGEPSYLSYSGSGYSGGSAGESAPVARYQSRVSAGTRTVYRSSGSASVSRGEETTSGRRFIGTIISSATSRPTYGSYRSRGYEASEGGSYATGSAGSSAGYGGGSASHSASGRAYESGSSSSASSSHSSTSSSSRAYGSGSSSSASSSHSSASSSSHAYGSGSSSSASSSHSSASSSSGANGRAVKKN